MITIANEILHHTIIVIGVCNWSLHIFTVLCTVFGFEFIYFQGLGHWFVFTTYTHINKLAYNNTCLHEYSVPFLLLFKNANKPIHIIV